MQIMYEHVWGSQERWDISLVKVTMACAPAEEANALDTGWLIYDNRWYQCRSVRIKTRSLTTKLVEGFVLEHTEIPDRTEILELWSAYLHMKGFSDAWDVFSDPDRSEWLLLRDGCGRLASFTKMIRYSGGMESQHNAYDDSYGLRLGVVMLDIESAHAHRNGYDHLYIGSGYEKGSLYKSKLNGFEFWDGTNWSDNIKAYRDMCLRDSSVSNLDDLNLIWNNT